MIQLFMNCNMSDITMCMNTRCPLAQKCKRSELSGTIPNKLHQSYSIFCYDFNTNKCEFFYPVFAVKR